jgi:flagellar protein FlgJ
MMDKLSLPPQANIGAPKPVNTQAATAEKARATGKQFEAMFMTQMLNHMFTGLDQGEGIFGGGQAESMFRPMLTEAYGKMVSNHGKGIGLADQVTRAMLKQQEV